ncbi:hypothetical protein [Actinomadura sp. SCN-SB]|uniref:hypothetical protein n=1 Tax=Actinomadura sp. SCN-SB TaxID=3373092 RepID=UPI0037515B0E
MPGAGPRDGPASAAVSRRAVVGGGAALAVPLLAGCGGGGDPEDGHAHAPDPAVPLLLGVMAAERDLIASYEAARRAHASLARHLDRPLAHHREHLAVLRRHYVPGTGARAHEGGALPAPRVVQAPGKASEALKELREAEARAAAARVAEVSRATPGLAQLLASIGACEAGHAAVLSRVEP